MEKIKNQTVEQFLLALASGDPTPGGGAAAAVTGAMAAALVGMVANLTQGMGAVARKANQYQKQLLELSDLDSLSFTQVMVAYRIPKSDTGRKTRIKKALKGAILIPQKTLVLSNKVLALAREMVAKGNKNALSDARSAVYLSQAAGGMAEENIKINRESLSRL